MSKPVLTKEIAYTALQDFFNAKPFVLFGTGTSCAIDLNFGMRSLQLHLSSSIPSQLFKPELIDEWKSVETTLSEDGTDFEKSMNAIKNVELLDLIIKETYSHVSRVDILNFIEISAQNKEWTATTLFKRLVDKLPENDPILHVATPNYDMLAEYAFTVANVLYTTGFWGGVVRKLNWNLCNRAMTYIEQIPIGRKVRNLTRIRKHIRLYKVHGSLNTFLINDEVIESDAWRDNHRDFVTPVIITPGASKHERLHAYRTSLLREFDNAANNHSSFLFLGFGFNDSQLLDDGIIRKIRSQSAQALIITRDLNERIKSLVNDSPNCWVVCKQELTNGARVFNSKFSQWLNLDEIKLWDFHEFTNEILGGNRGNS